MISTTNCLDVYRPQTRLVGARSRILLKKSDTPLDVPTNHAIVGTRNGILLKNTGNHIGLPLRDPLL